MNFRLIDEDFLGHWFREALHCHANIFCGSLSEIADGHQYQWNNAVTTNDSIYLM